VNKSKKIKILHICETSGIGGAETVMINIVSNLDTDQFESSAMLFADGWLKDKLISYSIPVYNVDSTNPRDYSLLWRMIKQIRKIKPDIIHSHLPDANFYCSILGFILRIPVIVTYHGKISSSANLRLMARIKYSVVKHSSTAVVAVSDFLNAELRKAIGFADKKVTTIYNGVRPSYPVPGFDSAAKRKELGIAPDDYIIANIANMRPDKGYEYFIRAAALIHKVIPNTTFLIVGEEWPPVKAMMIDEINKCGMNDYIRLTGFRSDVAELLSTIDIYMLSSVSEGLSISTIEAMSVGVPVVATRCGGPSEIIIDGENGLLVPIRDEKSLADKVIYLLQNKESAKKMAENAKQHVAKYFSIESMITGYQNLYKKVLSR
jgi:glycosyltransferase involved in cell wall biosynthesis